jgi:hypothetical protein
LIWLRIWGQWQGIVKMVMNIWVPSENLLAPQDGLNTRKLLMVSSNEDEMGKACRTNGEKRNAYRDSMENSKDRDE